MKALTNFINESVLDTNLNYKNKVTLKICAAFGFEEQDEWTDAVDNWVRKNHVKIVRMTTDDFEALSNMPKKIQSMYRDLPDTVAILNKKLNKNYETFIEDDDFILGGNDKVIFFASSGEDYRLCAEKIN
jgi:hypothetical protein